MSASKISPLFTPKVTVVRASVLFGSLCGQASSRKTIACTVSCTVGSQLTSPQSFETESIVPWSFSVMLGCFVAPVVEQGADSHFPNAAAIAARASASGTCVLADDCITYPTSLACHASGVPPLKQPLREGS